MLTPLQMRLFELQDKKYRDFHSKIIPNIPYENIIGIRIPILRKFAKEYAKENTEVFLHSLPHRYYEENNLHMMLITAIKDYDRCITEVENFLPYIDNWATCDFPAPACFKNNTDRLLTHIVKWIDSDEPYTIRYGIGMLMRLYLDDNFKDEYLKIVAQVKSEEYYVNMMIAWYMATALAKQWDSTIVYIEEKRLPEWVHKKTIRKAIESYRITDKQKEYLRTLI
ncbi:MAG: DNA alkylation repair protein [Lachnospiraceae bacterium]|nr:DNA alkylation repair protein [Lachnospiraceae bacterium]MEE0958452.1 DNA alkylation repair protein [Lachnospiraceae bacterium]